MKFFSSLVTVCMLAVGLVSCDFFRPFPDAGRDENGNVVLLDTPRMWEDFQGDIVGEIVKNIAGGSPNGGGSWNEYWLDRIRYAGRRENGQKYVDYIIQKRREAGLPELLGYP